MGEHKRCVLLLVVIDDKHLDGGMFAQSVSTFLQMRPCFIRL